MVSKKFNKITSERLLAELKGKTSSQTTQIKSGDIDEEKRTVVFSFSSELPYLRWFGYEKLSHAEGAQNHERMKSGGPFVKNHSNDVDDQIGIVEDIWIENGRGMAKVRFSKHAEREFDMVKEGILTNISFRYDYSMDNIICETRAEDAPDGIPTFLIPNYTIHEISLVAVPADHTVGIARDDGKFNDVNHKKEDEEKKEMAKNDDKKDDKKDAKNTIESRGRSDFLEMLSVGKHFGPDGEKKALQFIEQGKTINDLRKAIMDDMKNNRNVSTKKTSDDDIGLSPKENARYSISKALMAQETGSWKGAEFEREVSKASEQYFGKEARGFLVPPSVLRHMSRDAVTVGSPGSLSDTGGQFVTTDQKVDSFIELLNDRLVFKKLGVMTMDLKSTSNGIVSIPKQLSSTEASWVDEQEEVSQTNFKAGQIELSPKTIGAIVDISRRTLVSQGGSNSIDQLIVNDLVNSIARKIEYTAIYGNGVNSPKGIIKMLEEADRVMGLGANGGHLDFHKLIDLESKISDSNGGPGLAYLLNSQLRGKLKGTVKGKTGEFVQGYIFEGQQKDGSGILNGYRAEVTNGIKNNREKGQGKDLTTIVLGDWSNLVIASWSLLDITYNQWVHSTSGAMRISAFQDLDIGCRNVEGFAAYDDVKIGK